MRCVQSMLAIGLLCPVGMPYLALAAGTDSLTVNVSEDAYLGDATFTVSVDKKISSTILTASALHTVGDSQDITLSGTWGAGPHTVTVRFLKDAYGGSASKDRNLYVNKVTLNRVTSTKANIEIKAASGVDFPIAAIKTASVSLSMEPGVNLSGLETNSSKKPGVASYDYAIPTTTELDYYASKGVKVVRLPILWERLQPGLLSITPSLELDTEYLGYITKLMTYASSKGMGVIVDLHNYGAYNAIKMASSAGVSGPLFGAAWTTIASALKGTPGLLGYDLMNEPNGFPAHGIWQALAQYGINGVRAADMNTLVVVEGDAWAGAAVWNTQSGTMDALRDPAQKMMFEAHVYGDRDSSGTHFAWKTEAALGVTVNTIAERAAVFGAWCRTNAVQCMIGEVGVGNDSPSWNVELLNGLAQMKADGMLAVTYWAGGPWWGTYPMSVEPLSGKDRAQMTVLSAFVD